ncbi:spermidine synthase [Effusibacillus consociatus]|uniref:Polyamine aminopropyltransferase n=1 Tax=Effusibacillus consociatus TaxID=1117041 RepID=A0ABV9Q6A6_9BACL
MTQWKRPKSQMSSVRGDADDLIELQQLLAGRHRILYEGVSEYQDLMVLESNILRMYLNQQLQFSSLDERMYHEAFVHPVMLLAPRHARILSVGGNDGLLLREVLKYPDVRHVSLVHVSSEVLRVVQEVPEIDALNERAFSDKRLRIHDCDIEKFLVRARNRYNVIIVDFPDPVDKQISRLYTTEIFSGLSRLLTKDGVLVCQSHSPKKAPIVFWSIARTLESAGLTTISYHLTIPSFGDWGFHLAGKQPLIWRRKKVTVPHRTLPNDLSSWFDFPAKVLAARTRAPVNCMDRLTLHNFYARAQLIPTTNLTAVNDLASQDQDKGRKKEPHKYKVRRGDSNRTVRGDSEDLIELKQLLSGSNRILYQGRFKEDDVLIIKSKDVRMYLDKQLQFNSLDERIYHEALVHPVMTLVPERDRILIVGGGDGMALREVLKYRDVGHVDLVDLDPLVLQVALTVPDVVSLNAGSLYDRRVSVHQQDARVFLSKQREPYNVIIVDFPDPADKVISRLYTAEFFRRMFRCLTPDGILVCQSHSPENAPSVFWAIKKTLKSIGLKTLSYHVIVPSFGDWGFHLAAKTPLVWGDKKITVPYETIPEDLTSWFTFPQKILSVRRMVKANTLSRLRLHKYYRKEVGYKIKSLKLTKRIVPRTFRR